MITKSKADEFKAKLLTPIKDARIGVIAALSVFGEHTSAARIFCIYCCDPQVL